MGLRINTNVQSVVAQHRLARTTESLAQTQGRLASGSKINRALDDAAGLAISENIRASLRCTGQNIKNANEATLLLETAEGALNEITNIVIRMKELALQASSDTNGDKERAYLDGEYQSMKSELDRIAQTTVFNGRSLLTGESGPIQIQVGQNNQEAKDSILITTSFKVDTDELGFSGFKIDSGENARNTLVAKNDALDKLSHIRGIIGANEARLNASKSALGQYEESMAAGFSNIRDADLAFETSQLAKETILSQAGVSVLAQANSAPQLALKLLAD